MSDPISNDATLYTPRFVLKHVVRPTLAFLNLPFPDIAGTSERLVFSTAAHESMGFRRVYQVGTGPALGFWQIEPVTARDLWTRYVIGRTSPLALKLQSLVFPDRSRAAGVPLPLQPTDVMLRQLAINHPLGCALCRLKYFDTPITLDENTIKAPADCARVWKKYYNSEQGAGTIQEFLENWEEYVAPLYT